MRFRERFVGSDLELIGTLLDHHLYLTILSERICQEPTGTGRKHFNGRTAEGICTQLIQPVFYVVLSTTHKPPIEVPLQQGSCQRKKAKK
jgi:hypothetical protein